MSSSPTPGPWLMVENGPQCADGGRLYIDIFGAGHCRMIGTVYNMPGDRDRRLVDAALITAAPELLALAKQIASECAECGGDHLPDGAEVPCEGCADIRAVIAKAERKV